MSINQKSIALFVDHDFFGVLILNGIVEGLIEQGYKPVIFNAVNGRNTTPKIPHPEISKLFNNRIFHEVILPYIERQKSDVGLINLTPRRLSKKHGLTYHEIENPNDDFVREEINQMDNFAGAISQRFSQVFTPDTINFVQQKGFFWNMHSGLVPHYKGLLTLYPAIRNKEMHYGMTLHEMATFLDAGDVVGQTKHFLDPKKPIFELYLDTVQSGIEMILKNTKLMKEKGFVYKEKQKPPYDAGYYTNPTAEEFAEAASQGVVYADFLKEPFLMASQFVGDSAIQKTILAKDIQTYIKNSSVSKEGLMANSRIFGSSKKLIKGLLTSGRLANTNDPKQRPLVKKFG